MVPCRRVDLVYGVIGGELVLAVALGSLWALWRGYPGLITAALPQAGLITTVLLLEWRQARRPGAAIARPAVIAAVAALLVGLQIADAHGTTLATGSVLLGLLLVAGAGLFPRSRPRPAEAPAPIRTARLAAAPPVRW